MNKQDYKIAYKQIKKAIYEYCDRLHDIIYFDYKMTGKMNMKGYQRWLELERMTGDL